MATPACAHLDTIRDVTPSGDGCQECLRLCLACGHVGCCDSSPHKHATKHFHAEHHPIIASFEPGEDWKFCYVDNVMWE
jgi:uncharacterized UBP type Zn finger protein